MKDIQQLVSICVPIYNTKMYLSRCLDSIKNQTYLNIKVICVDDGSIDNSYEKVSEYIASDDRFILIRHETNCGLGIARNTALKYITEYLPDTSYIMFIDSDDYINTQSVESLVKIANDTNADIVLTNLTNVSSICDESHKINNDNSYTYSLVEYEDIMNKIIIDEIGSQVCGKLYKLSCFENVKFPEKNYYFEDLMTTHHICNNAKKIVVTDLICYYYYIMRLDSITTNPKNLVKGSLDRSIAFFERYEFCSEKYPKYVRETVLKKAVDFAGGGLRRLKSKMIGYEDAALVYSYIRKYRCDILHCKAISIFKRIAIVILEKLK